MVARSGAACHLDVGDAVADVIAADDLSYDHGKCRWCHRPADAKLAERAGQPTHMASLIDQSSMLDHADFVDAVGEQVSPVFDPDGGLAKPQVASVDVSDP
jgi:hypothetical protein